jgi:signal transduction histidine kinase
MNQRIVFRLIVYFATVVLLMASIGWMAHTSWRQIDDLHEQLSAKQWQSFQIADRLQQSVIGMNNLMLKYAAYRNQSDWTNFTRTSQEFGTWFNEQQPILSSQKEQPFLNDINIAYWDYLDAAYALNKKIYGPGQNSIRLAEFSDLEKESKRILDLGLQLSEAHQQSIDAIQKQNLHSLSILRFELLGALVVLLGVVTWLALVVYREMISPLQVQLVESRQLVERQEKLASLGMLAAGVAHEIRNPLTAIKAWLYLQHKHLKPGSPEFNDAELINGEITRLEQIVKDFLEFARPSEPTLVVTGAGQPLRDVQKLLQPQLEKNNIKLDVADVAEAEINIDPKQIKQVLINLVQNAADSIGHKGTITLSARRSEKRINGREKAVVILEVSDTGKGIPPEAEKRLFDPFFTTKDSGTGLGLPIAARIIEKHHGALQYQTRPDHGATFGIILPLHKT